MSDYDRNAGPRYGAGVSQAGYAQQVDQGLRAYMIGVYNHMMIGLAVTGLFALGIHMLTGPDVRHLTDFGRAIYLSPLKWVVMLAPLAFIFIFTLRLDRMSADTARITFFAFSAVMGISMSWILVVFQLGSIAQTFFITSAAFGGLSLYGYTTKRDLSPMGSFLIMGMIGLMIACVVNLFLHSSGLQWAISLLGVGIFAGLTAWDTQSIKEMYVSGDGSEVAAKKSIYGALQLYLDFINMFQFLLNLMGNRNN